MMQNERQQKAEPIELIAADGYRLAAMIYPPQAQQQEPARAKGNILVASATGVPQAFYRRFAEYASQQGFTVMTFDYRGIGQSNYASLKGFPASFLDWAKLDLAAAVDAMSEADVPLFMVGHSFGGQALGLLPNHHKVARLYTFATGAGWHGWMPFGEQIKVFFMWRLMGPLLTKWKGYLHWQQLGMGEDLPLGVYQQWKRWCRFPHYFFDDPTMLGVAEQFATVSTPIVAANALDDLWAPPSSRDAFLRGYQNAAKTVIDLDPRTTGPLGHMGYFRAKAMPLWGHVLEWFSEHRGV